MAVVTETDDREQMRKTFCGGKTKFAHCTATLCHLHWADLQGTVQRSWSTAQDDDIWHRSGVRECLFVNRRSPGEQIEMILTASKYAIMVAAVWTKSMVASNLPVRQCTSAGDKPHWMQ